MHHDSFSSLKSVIKRSVGSTFRLCVFRINKDCCIETITENKMPGPTTGTCLPDMIAGFLFVTVKMAATKIISGSNL